jgi:hypothetical protein
MSGKRRTTSALRVYQTLEHHLLPNRPISRDGHSPSCRGIRMNIALANIHCGSISSDKAWVNLHQLLRHGKSLSYRRTHSGHYVNRLDPHSLRSQFWPWSDTK